MRVSVTVSVVAPRRRVSVHCVPSSPKVSCLIESRSQPSTDLPSTAMIMSLDWTVPWLLAAKPLIVSLTYVIPSLLVFRSSPKPTFLGPMDPYPMLCPMIPLPVSILAEYSERAAGPSALTNRSTGTSTILSWYTTLSWYTILSWYMMRSIGTSTTRSTTRSKGSGISLTTTRSTSTGTSFTRTLSMGTSLGTTFSTTLSTKTGTSLVTVLSTV
mmetsp:Transcript_36354/g.89448  ORF Transcript_36354/g.89448 Transcript_36354/m.89448 type:complete len:214 (+) Transcript_36354:270-911(+)